MLTHRKVLVLAADLFEDLELLYPAYRLREEGVVRSREHLDEAVVVADAGQDGRGLR